MTRRDQAVVGVLAFILVVIVGAIGAPAFAPASEPSSPAASLGPVGSRPYREGIVGHPVSVNPLTAQTRADRDLVALLFDGLVALGPGDTLVPDLATRWTTDPTGKVWTFELRSDARWQDGVPLTAADVVFTVGLLQDPAYDGPTAASWRDVTATAIDDRTVRFQLITPLGGFLQAATQPILPAHLLDGVPVQALAADPFGRSPVGSGPFRLVSLDDAHAVLAPSAHDRSDSAGQASAGPSPDSLTTSAPTLHPVVGGLPGIEFRFYDDSTALAAAYEAGQLDAASGLSAADADRLGAASGSHLLRYPTTTLTAVFLNVRTSHPEFRDPRVRGGLLRAIDREALLGQAFGAAAVRADGLIPPTSWAFDALASPPLAFDRASASRALASAGWKASKGTWLRPGNKKPVTIELLSPDAATNPTAFAAASAIAANWGRLGLATTAVGLPPSELVMNRLRTGAFGAAVLDVNVGLDPDLYPLLASTQTRTQGLNVSGLQDQQLDQQLVAARAPGTVAVRKAAYTALQRFLASRQYVLPIAFHSEVVVVRDTLRGPSIRPISDVSGRFWDVLTWRLAIDR